jgi:tRNA(Ile)-lysidine synthase
MDGLLDKFIQTIEKHKMLKLRDSVLISLSGGLDSTLMTHLFNDIRKKYDLKLFVFHLNHKLRPEEAKKEAKFVNGLCNELKIKAFIKEFDVKEYARENKLSLQAAARHIRYKFLNELREEYSIDKIATAHNADDRVETVLIRMIRGTAGSGISGLSPVRDGYIIRPIIDIFRAEIESCADEMKLEFMTDSSNLKTVYLRNKVRLELIPYLAANYNKNIKQNILNFSKVAKLEDDLIREIAGEKYDEAIIQEEDESVSLLIPVLTRIEKALVNRIITASYYKVAPQGHTLTYDHVEKIDHMINSKKPNMSYNLPGPIVAMKSYDVLSFSADNIADFTGYEYEHNLGDSTFIKETGITVNSELIKGADIDELIGNKEDNEEFIDSGRLVYPVRIRSFRSGDHIHPLNMKGKKKLKDIFIDKKLPVTFRHTVPIFVSGEDIFLVPYVCISDDFKVTADTKSVVRFTFS